MAARDVSGAGANVGARSGRASTGGTIRRLSTETKAAFKTTEFFAYLAVLAGVLIAGLVVDNADGKGAYGAQQVWLYATILTVGYMISRGLAKSGSREPYDEERDRHDRH